MSYSGGILADQVFALALDADGSLLVGGDFITLDGEPRYGLARLRRTPTGQRLSEIRADNSHVEFRLQASPGAYRIEISSDLRTWRTLRSLTITNTSALIRDDSAAERILFYRAVQP